MGRGVIAHVHEGVPYLRQKDLQAADQRDCPEHLQQMRNATGVSIRNGRLRISHQIACDAAPAPGKPASQPVLRENTGQFDHLPKEGVDDLTLAQLAPPPKPKKKDKEKEQVTNVRRSDTSPHFGSDSHGGSSSSTDGSLSAGEVSGEAVRTDRGGSY